MYCCIFHCTVCFMTTVKERFSNSLLQGEREIRRCECIIFSLHVLLGQWLFLMLNCISKYWFLLFIIWSLVMNRAFPPDWSVCGAQCSFCISWLFLLYPLPSFYTDWKSCFFALPVRVEGHPENLQGSHLTRVSHLVYEFPCSSISISKYWLWLLVYYLVVCVRNGIVSSHF